MQQITVNYISNVCWRQLDCGIGCVLVSQVAKAHELSLHGGGKVRHFLSVSLWWPKGWGSLSGQGLALGIKLQWKLWTWDERSGCCGHKVRTSFSSIRASNAVTLLTKLFCTHGNYRYHYRTHPMNIGLTFLIHIHWVLSSRRGKVLN